MSAAPTAVQEAAGAWFARRRSGTMTPAEARALEAWLAEDPRHAAAFEAIEQAWGEVEDFRRAPEILALRERARGRRSGLTRAVVSRAAAAVLAVGVLGLGGYGLKAGGLIDFDRYTKQQYATRVGEKTSVTLPDGSVVTLNTDTVLRTAPARDKRIVYLDKGQAFFRVAKDADRPFEVHAAGRVVTAVGTAFDVRVEGGRFAVTLVEGKVRVAAPVAAPTAAADKAAAAVRTTEMLAGDQFVALGERQWTVARTNAVDETSWLVGRLKFEGKPLGEVVTEFNRYSTRKVVVADPALAARPISGAFRADDQEAFIEALEIAGLARVESESGDVIRLGPGEGKNISAPDAGFLKSRA